MSQEPKAVYKFDGATVRIYGTCTNIREETEKFLKQVARMRRKKEVGAKCTVSATIP